MSSSRHVGRSHPQIGLSLVVVVLIGLVVAASPLPARSAPPPGGTFTDDDGNFHEGAIEAISAEQITRGCNSPYSDHYCPAGVVDRGAMAAFLTRALSLPPTTVDHFRDDEGSPFENEINAVAEAGITSGCSPSGDSYCPNRILRRDEMAAFLSRALDFPDTSTDFFSDDDGLLLEADINAIAAAGITTGCKTDHFCPHGTLRRDEMASFLARSLDLTLMPPPPRPELAWQLVVDGLDSPIQSLALPGDQRLLIAQQGGLIKSFTNGALSPTPFLDIRDEVTFSGERGLLSMAVHPNYPIDRRLFAWYYGTDSRTHLVEYDITPDLQSATSPRTVLSVAQPFTNHNGGFLAFGPDGYLYLSLGDGGGGNDPGGRARDLRTLLGKMIRIDVNGALPYGIPADNPYVGSPGLDEIWASGLRNPWRWSFDDGGHMYIGDVGQSSREEVNVVDVAPVGYDFGWSRYEGSLCNPNDTDPSCSTTGLTHPLVEYGRSSGRSVVGGIVYRGPTVRSLSQFYLYADVFSGVVRGFRLNDGRPIDQVDLTDDLGMSGIVDFAEDVNGELMVTSLFAGAVYRLTGG